MSDGLLVKLTTQGSPYSISNGQTPYVNPLSTKQSTLHYDPKTNTDGYSVGGKLTPAKLQTIQNYTAYNDGVFNPIPSPTTLDINDPEGADPNYKLKFTSIEGSKYEDSSFK
jgi:hypothetical protein